MPTKEKAAGSGATGALVIAVVALGLGFYAGYAVGGKQQWSVGYAAGAATTKKELAARLENILGAPAQAEDVKTVTGKVLGKTGDGIVIETPQLVRDPLAEPAPTRRTVLVTAGTTITLTEPVSPTKLAALEEQFRKEQDAYLKELEAGKAATAPTPPSPLAERAGTIADIAIGQEVAVTAKEGILRAETIDAVSIRVSPPAPVPSKPDAAGGTTPSLDTQASQPSGSSAGVPATGASAGKTPGSPTPLPPTSTTDTPTTNAATGTK